MRDKVEEAILQILAEKQLKTEELIDKTVYLVTPGIMPSKIEPVIFEIRECIWRLLSTKKIELLPTRELALLKDR